MFLGNMLASCLVSVENGFCDGWLIHTEGIPVRLQYPKILFSSFVFFAADAEHLLRVFRREVSFKAAQMLMA